MRTHRLLFLGLFVILFAAAFPASAQPPGYCGGETCHNVPCSMECLVCPGTCIEYRDLGCPDCAQTATCGEFFWPPYCFNSTAPSTPAPGDSPTLPGLTQATPAPQQPSSVPARATPTPQRPVQDLSASPPAAPEPPSSSSDEPPGK
jgi:hypothetical protein